jgi:hypothetical protein
MPDLNELRAQADFATARTRAFFRDLLAVLTNRPNRLLAFDQVAAKLYIGGPVYLGVRQVQLDHIIGSTQRYRDFDRAFLPLQSHTANRWMSVQRAWYEDVSLPPVLLYQVGEIYFVADGHHRVSVARQRGETSIDAEVRQCQVKVPVTPDVRPEDLEILGAKARFFERTQLDQLRPEAQIEVTILGGYERLVEHIAVHRHFMGLDYLREISEPEAVEHWYDAVYLPVINVIRTGGLLAALPDRTASDFYLWVMDHQHYLVSQGMADLVSPDQAAETFLNEVKSNEPGIVT